MTGPNLEQLFKFCQHCGAPLRIKKKKVTGGMVTYDLECLKGHSYQWQSSPIENRQPAINLALAAAVVVNGNTFSDLDDFAKTLNLQILSRSRYQQIQKQYIFPVIQEAWKAEQDDMLSIFKNAKDLVLAGDGRCDSPGHNAQYGTYTLMDASSKEWEGSRKILDIQLVRKNEVGIIL